MVRSKELTQGSGMKVDSYRTRPDGDVSEAARIGDRVGIRKSLGTEAIA